MHASTGRRGVKIAQWVFSRGLAVPQLRDDEWDLPGACRHLEEASGVPARRWAELATVFLDRLGSTDVWRAPDVDSDPGELMPS
ncbi:hypothetical protein [Actinomycetospora termitidis]|uniref:Uncharacterized protein n=1 Tax=Actinomycetospora termitidis TaxID=3053470 RepID=A0ABT7MHF0_9PSEU|nr:hypothetical protein [Actinomycetospora sp. Odt1-22]MDL5159302.1 hypothetical protein [Actinomycetospora sp. Odt1-22]